MLTRNNTLCQKLELFDEYKLRISRKSNDENFELENNRLLNQLRYMNKLIRREDRIIKQINFHESSKNINLSTINKALLALNHNTEQIRPQSNQITEQNKRLKVKRK